MQLLINLDTDLGCLPGSALQNAGVPTVPGSDGLVKSVEDAVETAKRVRRTAPESCVLPHA